MSVARELRETGSFVLGELKPRGRLLTPFNVISIPVIVAGAILIAIRFAFGLGSVTNLNQEYPWGLWIGFDVITGVAFAGGAYVLTFMVYVLRMEKYHPIVRVTVLNGFLAYLFYAGALLLDLGRPWNVINPIIGNSFGVSSVLFLVAWHFLLYMLAELVEFSPAIAEWLGKRRLRRILGGMTLGAVILGITLSTLHQSGLGALYLMAKGKIHPLWYSEFIPLLFLVSSVFAGLSMVIFEGSISHRVFRHRVSPTLKARHDSILIGLSRICAGTMFVYLALQALVFIHGRRWGDLGSAWGRLVPLRDRRFRGGSDGAIRACRDTRPDASGQDRRRDDPRRNRAEPAERLDHRVQVVRERPLRSHLDGGGRDARRRVCRDLGLSLGRQPDAGAERSARVGRGARAVRAEPVRAAIGSGGMR